MRICFESEVVCASECRSMNFWHSWTGNCVPEFASTTDMASSVWENLQLSAVSFLDRARVELENSKLGLNWTLVVLVVLSILTALVLRTWLSGRYDSLLLLSPSDHVIALLAFAPYSTL